MIFFSGRNSINRIDYIEKWEGEDFILEIDRELNSEVE